MKPLLLIFIAVVIFSLWGCGGGAGGGGAGGGNAAATSTPDDPLYEHAWHLHNTGQNAFATNGGISGYDLNLTQTIAAGHKGAGVKILVSDTGVESEHEDLRDNFIFGVSKDYTSASPYISNTAEPSDDVDVAGVAGDPHGTMVAGIIASVGWNEKGSIGVAPEAKIASANILRTGVDLELDQMIDQASGAFDIFNQSWGIIQCFLSGTNDDYLDQIKYGATSLRDGKGAIYVKSAGNHYTIDLDQAICGNHSITRVGNANFDFNNTNPYTIVVAAINSSGMSSSYSSPGSNIWIASPGGEDGATYPAIITTDRSGCTLGNSTTDASANTFEAGGNSNTDCDYTSTMNGTSSAAPMISGSVALLLDSNPLLTARDVKHLLATTARQIDTDGGVIPNPYVDSPSGHTWEQGWITNAAGYKFHNWYGFGLVDVDSAVTMATNNYTTLPTQYETVDGSENWLYSSGVLSLSIPDNSSTGRTSAIQVRHNLKIEAVQIKLNVTHPWLGDLGVELVSPSGTKSILTNVNNALHSSNFVDTVFLSNAFYGESSLGNWTLKIIDGAALDTGTLTNWKINIFGNEGGMVPAPVYSITHNASSNSTTQSPLISWQASPSHNVLRYEYSLGTSPGATNIKDWTSNDLNTSVTATGLSLSNGQTIYVNVRAISANNISSVVTSSSGWTVAINVPIMSISGPSSSTTKSGPITYTVTYTGATSVTLNSGHITLNKTGTADGAVSVSGSGATTRTVTINSITGDGTIGISIASGTAVDGSANPATAAGPSTTFTVANTGPGIGISSPSSAVTNTGPITYTISYSDASSIGLVAGNITLNRTGTANGTVSILGTGTSSRTVRIASITGNGTIGISVASGTASDSVGNTALAAGPSVTFTVTTATICTSCYADEVAKAAGNVFTPSGKNIEYISVSQNGSTFNVWREIGGSGRWLKADGTDSWTTMTVAAQADVAGRAEVLGGLYYTIDMGTFSLSAEFGVTTWSSATCNYVNENSNTTNVCANLGMRLPSMSEVSSSAACPTTSNPCLSCGGVSGIPGIPGQWVWTATACSSGTSGFYVWKEATFGVYGPAATPHVRCVAQ